MEGRCFKKWLGGGRVRGSDSNMGEQSHGDRTGEMENGGLEREEEYSSLNALYPVRIEAGARFYRTLNARRKS